jgi:hypothetical protein
MITNKGTTEAAPVPGLKLAEMTMTELDALDRARTLIAVPVSPLEEHGPHLPLGTDGFMAEGMIDGVFQRLAASHPDWTLVRAPWFPVGCYTLHHPGSIEVPQETVRAVVEAIWVGLSGPRTKLVRSKAGLPKRALTPPEKPKSSVGMPRRLASSCSSASASASWNTDTP